MKRGVERPGWTWFCGLSSLALLLTIVALAGHIRFALGRWLAFGEDPGTLLFRTHELLLVGIGLFALYAAAPLWLVLLCYRSFRLAWFKHVMQAVLFGAGWLLIFLAGKYDPTPFTYWFLD